MWKISKGRNCVSKTFRLPEEIVEQLERLALKNNLSVNQVVIQCLDYAIENLDKEEQ